jgi:pyrroloquinoline quinone biosynthesis protein D
VNAIDGHSRPALAAGARLQADRVTGEPVVLLPEGIQVLNETAHAIVSRCDGKCTVEEIVAALAEEYDAPVDALREDVLACLSELRDNKVIVIS